jgi:hypothetical protein
VRSALGLLGGRRDLDAKESESHMATRVRGALGAGMRRGCDAGNSIPFTPL